LITKPAGEITIQDIEALVSDQVPESRTIDYKRELPGRSDEDKREFLADVSSFANSIGGRIVYGITEKEGLPEKAIGLSDDIDAAIQRLDSIVRDGIDPRIMGIEMIPVPGFSNGPVLLVRIPKSWSGPHMVVLKNLSRFYTRNSAGKHQMDIVEIRAAFALSESLTERIRKFRDGRLAKIIAGDTPIPLTPNAKLVLHIVPLISFSVGADLDMGAIGVQGRKLPPIGNCGWSHRFNVDGLVTFSRNGPSESYCQVFRSGQIEAVYSDLAPALDNIPSIRSVAYEKDTIKATKQYVQVLKDLNVPYPLLIMMSMTGVVGCRMYVGPRFLESGDPIDRDVVILPDILLDEYPQDVSRDLRPMFDAVWNACGFERSYNYDDKGNWNPDRQ
jgi:hypothetical protein